MEVDNIGFCFKDRILVRNFINVRIVFMFFDC